MAAHDSANVPANTFADALDQVLEAMEGLDHGAYYPDARILHAPSPDKGCRLNLAGALISQSAAIAPTAVLTLTVNTAGTPQLRMDGAPLKLSGSHPRWARMAQAFDFSSTVDIYEALLAYHGLVVPEEGVEEIIRDLMAPPWASALEQANVSDPAPVCRIDGWQSMARCAALLRHLHPAIETCEAVLVEVFKDTGLGPVGAP